MWVIDLENPPPKLRGILSRWGVEVRAGLFVGSSSGKARDAIWELVVATSTSLTSAVMVYDSRGPQGFEARTIGPNRRRIVDVDGLWLAQFSPPTSDAAEPSPDSVRPDQGPEPWDIDEGYLEP